MPYNDIELPEGFDEEVEQILAKLERTEDIISDDLLRFERRFVVENLIE